MADEPAWGDERTAAVNAFANRVADYVMTHPDYSAWTARRVAVEAVTVAMEDAWHEVQAVAEMDRRALLPDDSTPAAAELPAGSWVAAGLQEAEPAPPKVVDLMQALEDSIAAAKAERRRAGAAGPSEPEPT